MIEKKQDRELEKPLGEKPLSKEPANLLRKTNKMKQKKECLCNCKLFFMKNE